MQKSNVYVFAGWSSSVLVTNVATSVLNINTLQREKEEARIISGVILHDLVWNAKDQKQIYHKTWTECVAETEDDMRIIACIFYAINFVAKKMPNARHSFPPLHPILAIQSTTIA